MRVKIEKSIACGRVVAPPSKSISHRLLIAAALCEGESRICKISSCEDVSATLNCLSALGITVKKSGDDVTVTGRNFKSIKPLTPLKCGESGSTLRFLFPLALLSEETTVFLAEERLLQRPMEVYEKLCATKGLYYVKDGHGFTVRGPLKSGEYRVAGNVSSQFISGLILALPCLDGDSIIKIEGPIESTSYINLTLDTVRKFGIKAEWSDGSTLKIPGNQTYIPVDLTVEGDFSGAAFTDAFNVFGGDVTVLGLNEDSWQGDRVYRQYFDILNSGYASVSIEDCPDLAPILFAIAAAKHGATFTGTKRLGMKESDRAHAMAEELKKFGATVTVDENSVEVLPTRLQAPKDLLCGHNDHRIVMALSVLLTLTGGEIDGAECVKKSYPAFFDDLKMLGIKISVKDSELSEKETL